MTRTIAKANTTEWTATDGGDIAVADYGDPMTIVNANGVALGIETFGDDDAPDAAAGDVAQAMLALG